MNKIEFINDSYTKDNMRLPIVHFNSNEKNFCSRNVSNNN